MFFVNNKFRHIIKQRENGTKIIELVDYSYFKLFEQCVFIEDQIYRIIQKYTFLDNENKVWFENISSNFSNYLNRIQEKIELYVFEIDDLNQIEAKLNEFIYSSKMMMLDVYKKISFKYYEITNENLQTTACVSDYKQWSQMHEFQHKMMLDYESLPYQILGIEKNASKVEIKKAYLSLSKKFHPDFNKSTYAEEIMLIINNAYEQLKDL